MCTYLFRLYVLAYKNFLRALENAGRTHRPVTPRSKINIPRANVKFIRSLEVSGLDFPYLISLDDGSPFVSNSIRLGDGQHYRTILPADPSYVFP
jgi:hypothetical protein